MKNVILLQNYYLPWELEKEMRRFIEYLNNSRYHESINNLILRDVFYGRESEIITRRERIKRRTLELIRNLILKNIYNNQSMTNQITLLIILNLSIDFLTVVSKSSEDVQIVFQFIYTFLKLI